MSVEESELAQRAASGDGRAFAELYDCYSGSVYNLCYRITSSADDAADATQQSFLTMLERLPKLSGDKLNFAAYILTVARHASYRLMKMRKRTQPAEETVSLVDLAGAGSGGSFGPHKPGPEEDPERAALLSDQQESIRVANSHLPERQREVLALREVEEMSYGEIATVMETSVNSVSQLISRARLNLRDELRGSALASIALSAPDCERALPLIAMRQDGQLPAGEDQLWLEDHLTECETCRVSTEAMEEAGVSYRAWAPIVPLAVLRDATIARAAEQVGVNWNSLLGNQSAHSLAVARHTTGWARRALVGGLATVAGVGGVLLASQLPANDGGSSQRDRVSQVANAVGASNGNVAPGDTMKGLDQPGEAGATDGTSAVTDSGNSSAIDRALEKLAGPLSPAHSGGSKNNSTGGETDNQSSSQQNQAGTDNSQQQGSTNNSTSGSSGETQPSSQPDSRTSDQTSSSPAASTPSTSTPSTGTTTPASTAPSKTPTTGYTTPAYTTPAYTTPAYTTPAYTSPSKSSAPTTPPKTTAPTLASPKGKKPPCVLSC